MGVDFFSEWNTQRLAMERAEKDFRKEEWTLCQPNCAYCNDMFYGHSKPHPGQTRISDGISEAEFFQKYLNESEVKE